ncbi:hypothetical protein RUM43_010430 [Polyplax serrata]|uniref:Uncharacterized protein n=1 Tax=Polyplax serrata TaxID=468196 RepID=A0AAN8PKU7_POLSC
MGGAHDLSDVELDRRNKKYSTPELHAVLSLTDETWRSCIRGKIMAVALWSDQPAQEPDPPLQHTSEDFKKTSSVVTRAWYDLVFEHGASRLSLQWLSGHG